MEGTEVRTDVNRPRAASAVAAAEQTWSAGPEACRRIEDAFDRLMARRGNSTTGLGILFRSPRNGSPDQHFETFDGLGMGIGFLFGLCVIGAIRELSGTGTFLGYDVLGFKPLLVMILPAGGFFVIGFIMAALNYIEYRLTGKLPTSGGAH